MSRNNVNFVDFVAELSDLLSKKIGKDSSILFKTCPPKYEISQKQILNYPTKYNLKNIPSEWRDIVHSHIETRCHLILNNYKQALDTQSTCCKLLVQQIDSWNNWILPILYTFMNDLKKIAIQTDISDNIDRTSGCNLEEATHIMNRAFTSCLTNSNQNLRTSNMLGTYKMINILLSVHSYLNTLDLCKSLIGAVETEPDLVNLERFPKSDQVTFHYYYGRMEFFKEKFTKAEEHLTKAFKLCHYSHKSNQRRILIYLIPILINRGILPDIKVLSKHRTLQKIYGPLLNAIYEADVSKYNKLLEQYMDQLSKMHVLMMFERLRTMCLRNLCKKVYINLDRPKRLTFQQIHIALNCAGLECDEDEAVGVFSTIISKGYAAGYVAYTHNVVMISQKTGFHRLPLNKS